MKIRRALLILAIVVGVGAVSYVEFYLRRPIGEGPAGSTVDLAPFQERWTDKRVVLVGIGDSVTAGLGAKSKSHSYFERIASNPVDEWDDMKGIALDQVLPNLEKLNIAVSGSTSLQHLESLSDKLPEFEEDQFGIVVLTTGGNDIIHSYGRMPPKEGAMYGASLEQALPWIENFSARLEEMIQIISDRFPGGCEIYLADIYDPTDGVGDAISVYLPKWNDGIHIHSRYNERIRKVAEQFSNVHVVPLHQTFLGHGSHCRQFWRSSYDWNDPHYWFYVNIEDPNDRGYDAIRRAFLNSIVANTQLRSVNTQESE